jgi:2-amino-4-hydroxy-6-hydroxymethyldihydropteridine diphosphokinase
VGIGSNLSGPVDQVDRGLEALSGLPESGWFRSSSKYASAPLGTVSQPDYVNAVCGFLTRLQPESLLHALLDIERKAGRDRSAGEKWGPRILDLDLLVYGAAQIDSENLKLPHPGISQRNFVLLPLAEIAPTLRIPGHGQLAKLLQSTDWTTIRRIA